jgi:hypothetical protein
LPWFFSHTARAPLQRQLSGAQRYDILLSVGRRPHILVMRRSWLVGRDSVEPLLDFVGKSHGSTESRPTLPRRHRRIALLCNSDLTRGRKSVMY